MYETPNVGGFRLAAAVFDPVNLAGAWEATRTPRPEAEATYDLASGNIKAHLFVNGAYQKVYNGLDSETVAGAGYGGSFEYGPIHVGAGGHYGRGLGLYYALEGSAADVSNVQNPKPREFRTGTGYSIFGQYAAGPVDINLAYGVSQINLLPFDKDPPAGINESVIKTQTGISAGLVYHVSDSLHLSADYLRAAFAWYRGESQTVNFVSTGVTLTW